MAAEIAEAEKIYNENNFKGVYEYLYKLKDSEDPEILWRLVRAIKDRSDMKDIDKNKRKEMIMEGYDIAEKALKLGEDIFACHKVSCRAVVFLSNFIYFVARLNIKKSEVLTQFMALVSFCNPEKNLITGGYKKRSVA